MSQCMDASNHDRVTDYDEETNVLDIDVWMIMIVAIIVILTLVTALAWRYHGAMVELVTRAIRSGCGQNEDNYHDYDTEQFIHIGGGQYKYQYKYQSRPIPVTEL